MRQQDGQRRGTALVTGATGYIGSRLVPALLADGWTVRVLTRSADRLRRHRWGDRVEVAEGSADDRAALDEALAGVDVAFWLIHSMDGDGDFAARDRELTGSFAEACDRAGVGRIVYLGGLYPEGEELSPHLASRREVEQIVLAARTPAVVLRAAVVVGSGSASFEMLRHLTERLPVVLGPAWLDNRIQPVAIADVLRYLTGVAAAPGRLDRAFDIGGPEVLTYRQMIQRYARQAGLPPRLVRTVPALIPRLASQWVGLVTPVPSGLAQPLVGSLVHEVVCGEHDIAEVVPDPPQGLRGFDGAVADALAEPDPERFPAGHSDADPSWAGPVVNTDRYTTTIAAAPEDVWAALRAVVLGHPAARGWWVEQQSTPPHRLVLRPRRELTGRTQLTATVEPVPAGSRLTLRTEHRPRGLAGQLGWVLSAPLRVVAQVVGQRAVAQQAVAGREPAAGGAGSARR
ncbi:NAD(P)H-binding protein [Desertihabitans aurantiacus]|uniref:NAD(P)H-binding protein n=1 Tax=Desertihabitans aurantiacus TaxID=2282477 RepID=UPI001E52216F|nr:NAD(P)H-binding protein [Desertihabitans aurantiacus]